MHAEQETSVSTLQTHKQQSWNSQLPQGNVLLPYFVPLL